MVVESLLSEVQIDQGQVFHRWGNSIDPLVIDKVVPNATGVEINGDLGDPLVIFTPFFDSQLGGSGVRAAGELNDLFGKADIIDATPVIPSLNIERVLPGQEWYYQGKNNQRVRILEVLPDATGIDRTGIPRGHVVIYEKLFNTRFDTLRFGENGALRGRTLDDFFGSSAPNGKLVRNFVRNVDPKTRRGWYQ